MIDKTQEIMMILAEECAEVIQAISKCQRFGAENFKPHKPLSNGQHLAVEIGDVLAMVDLLKLQGVVQESDILLAREMKFEKLRKWSSIFQDTRVDLN